jgi:hypothetical protein
MGNWEVRDEYVLEMERLPAFATGYCYGKRVEYIDKESLYAPVTDMWDTSGHLYKWLPAQVAPQTRNLGRDSQYYSLVGSCNWGIVNFLDNHQSLFTCNTSCFDDECPSGYADITRYALPQGLMKIVQ